MFKLMNSARIAVGMQGLSVASSAYLNALEYARERKQGSAITHWKDATAPRVPILEHADVRRMLLDMKSRVEGIRALAVKLAHHQDRCARCRGKDETKAAYHQGQVDLLVPLVKAYGSDQGFRVCETAIQTYGGAGYTKDFPVEQYCRDAKIFSIYEGTNHIQAMDLVGRKLGQAGGANLQAFLADVATFVQRHRRHAALGAAAKTLGAAQEALGWQRDAAAHVVPDRATSAMVPLQANRFLEMMAETTVGWMLLEGAAVALEEEGVGRRAPGRGVLRRQGRARRCTTRATCSRPSSSRRSSWATRTSRRSTSPTRRSRRCEGSGAHVARSWGAYRDNRGCRSPRKDRQSSP